jgi:hypothetical protein
MLCLAVVYFRISPKNHDYGYQYILFRSRSCLDPTRIVRLTCLIVQNVQKMDVLRFKFTILRYKGIDCLF